MKMANKPLTTKQKTACKANKIMILGCSIQICSLNAKTAKALTMVLGGFVLHLVSTPNAILIPARLLA